MLKRLLKSKKKVSKKIEITKKSLIQTVSAKMLTAEGWKRKKKK